MDSIGGRGETNKSGHSLLTTTVPIVASLLLR